MNQPWGLGARGLKLGGGSWCRFGLHFHRSYRFGLGCTAETLTPAQVDSPRAEVAEADIVHRGVAGGADVATFQEGEATLGGSVGDTGLGLPGEGAGATTGIAIGCGTGRSSDVGITDTSADIGAPTGAHGLTLPDGDVVVDVGHDGQEVHRTLAIHSGLAIAFGLVVLLTNGEIAVADREIGAEVVNLIAERSFTIKAGVQLEGGISVNGRM